MLVLTREAGQSIVIGDDAKIRVKVLTNDGRHIRLGIEAPTEVIVNREEVHQRIQQRSKRITEITIGEAVLKW